MITEIVSFNCHPRIDRDKMIRGALGTFELWTYFPGLVRKIFVRDRDSLAITGIYLWETLKDANKRLQRSLTRAHVGALETTATRMKSCNCLMNLENSGGTPSEI